MKQRESERSIKFRLANYTDARALADLHYVCSMEQPNGFMFLLGKRFLITYYTIILRNRSSMVLCAEDEDMKIVGLLSASLEAGEELKALKHGRFRLLIAALPAMIKKPSLIASAYARVGNISGDKIGKGFVIGSGARLSYWGWSPDHRDQGQSIKFLKIGMQLLKSLGVCTVRLEVDSNNRKVVLSHRFMGGKVIDEFLTKDGRKRIIMEHRI